MHTPDAWKIVRFASGGVLLLGVLLAAMMIQTESEPGALPLALILLGVSGYAIAVLKSRRKQRRG